MLEMSAILIGLTGSYNLWNVLPDYGQIKTLNLTLFGVESDLLVAFGNELDDVKM